MVQAIRLLALVAPVALAACSSSAVDYPSLAIRDVERVSGTMEVPPPPPLPDPPPATLASLDDLAATARTAHQQFLAAAPRARSVASSAAGTRPGSDAWAQAQVAIADLEAQRSQAMIALADLDRIYVQSAVDAQDTAAITAVRAEIDALVVEEDALIRDLLRTLGS